MNVSFESLGHIRQLIVCLHGFLLLGKHLFSLLEVLHIECTVNIVFVIGCSGMLGSMRKLIVPTVFHYMLLCCNV